MIALLRPSSPARTVTRPGWPAVLLMMAFAIGLLAAWQPAHAADDFLEPDKAFVFSARPLDDRRVEVTFDIAPGYYLYREQFKFKAGDGATLGTAEVPKGKVKFDETFQKDVETHRDTLKIVLPVTQAPASFRLVTTYQGCADAGLCYPPQDAAATVSLAGFGGNGSVLPADAAGGGGSSTPSLTSLSAAPATGAAATPAPGELSRIEQVLQGGALWPVIGVFFIAGLLLSLTPCVLPMLPIISSIIVGEGAAAARGVKGDPSCATVAVSRRRAFALALAYSLGMTVVYTGLGIAAGLAGEGLAASLQKPWVLTLFALGLAGLSLSMFGVYELRMPHGWTHRMTATSNRLPGGEVAGVAAMGGVSALIVSPCVAAPLAGALLYLSQTRDVWMGGAALFALSLGMSVPLLLVGTSAGALLPRAGPWMDEVKAAFGVLLLGVALWTLQPVLPARIAVLAWGALALGTAVAVVIRGRQRARARAARAGTAPRFAPWRIALASVFGVVGLMQVVGAATGATDPLKPLARLTGAAAEHGPAFAPIKSSADLDAAIRRAGGKPVMLDFYADWCVSCKEMDRFTFADANVQQRLEGAVLLRADVTANDAADRELLRRFRLFGPPGILFFGPGGQELTQARVIGFQKASTFQNTLGAAGL